jgi:hypothetical protein
VVVHVRSVAGHPGGLRGQQLIKEVVLKETWKG